MSGEAKIMVTGGTGVIGAWVVMGLVNRGLRPTVLVRGISSAGRPILRDIEDKIDWVYGDIEDPWLLCRTITQRKIDSIIHLASAKPWQIDASFVPEPKAPVGVNNIIKGTLNILEAARSTNIRRVVYASSKAVYGPVTGMYSHPDYQLLPEEHECRPVTLYGICKLAAEHLGLYYHKHLGVDFVALRFASTFGPLKRGTNRSPAVFVRQALLGKPISIIKSPKKDEFVYNKDVAEGLCLACLQPRLRHRIFNIGTGRGHSFHDLADAVRSVLPEADFRWEEGDFSEDACVYDISKAREDLGYEPRYDLEAAMRDLVTELRRIEP